MVFQGRLQNEAAEKFFLGIAKLVGPGKIKVRSVCLISQEWIFGCVRIQLIRLFLFLPGRQDLLFELGMGGVGYVSRLGFK